MAGASDLAAEAIPVACLAARAGLAAQYLVVAAAAAAAAAAAVVAAAAVAVVAAADEEDMGAEVDLNEQLRLEAQRLC